MQPTISLMGYGSESSSPATETVQYREPVRILASARPQQALGVLPFTATRLPDGRPWLALFRRSRGYLVRLPGLVDFEIQSGGGEITIYPVPDVSPETIDHFYLNQALPLALRLQNVLVLHGSAVDADGAAIAFVGDSGRGKSTLAASLSTSGWPFLTDDSLILEPDHEGYFARPTHPSLRLWSDSARALASGRPGEGPPTAARPKARVLADQRFNFCAEPRRMLHVYFLGDRSPNSVLIEDMNARDSVIELVRHCFLLSADERDSLPERGSTGLFFLRFESRGLLDYRLWSGLRFRLNLWFWSKLRRPFRDGYRRWQLTQRA